MDNSIYKITNTVTEDCYIGSTTQTKRRWVRHRNRLRKGDHHSLKLQRAWDKYGEDAFTFSVLMFDVPTEDLVAIEQIHIDEVKPAYNMKPTAGHSWLGCSHREETKEKMRKPKSKEHAENIRRAKMGTKFSDEAKAKMSAAKKGRTMGEEQKQKISEGVKRAKSNGWSGNEMHGFGGR